MPTRRQRLLGAQSGSAIVAALVMTFVLALLGFALFDLAVVENRLVIGSEASSKAFEVAQVGLDHALYLLQQDLCGVSSTCQVSPPTGPWGWGDGTPWALTAPYTGTGGAFDPPVISKKMQNGGSSGSYTVQVLNVDKAGATALGLPCTTPTGSICADVIMVRSTGTATVGPTTVSRTVQAVAQAVFKNNPNAAGGVSAGGASGAPLTGNARIAGSVHIFVYDEDEASSCGAALCLTGSAQVQNDYTGMPTNPVNLANLVPVLPTTADGAPTLHATVRVGTPPGSFTGPYPIDLGGSAKIGTASAPMDGVYLGRGCGAAPQGTTVCSDVVHSGGLNNVYSKNQIKPYDIFPVPSFPRLTDAFKLNDIDYTSYANCTDANNCPGTNDFFISHAFKITSVTQVDTPINCAPISNNNPPRLGPCNLFNILTGGSAGAGPGSNNQKERWDASTPSFTKTFTCGIDATCDDTSGKRINGAIGTGAQPSAFQLQWNNATRTLGVKYKDPVTGLFTNNLSDSTGTGTVLPILVYVDGPLMVCQGCATTFYYVGQAAFLAKGYTDRTQAKDVKPKPGGNGGDIRIDPTLYPCPGACGTDHQAFPQKSLLMFYTPGKIYLAPVNGTSTMGLFYAGKDSGDPAGGSALTIDGSNVNVVGWLAARTFALSGNPAFFEVVAALPATSMPLAPLPTAGVGGGGGGAAWWHVKTTKWLECRGALPSGPCQ